MIMSWLLTINFWCRSKPGNKIKSDNSGFLVSFHIRYSRAVFLFPSYKRLFPSCNRSYKTKAIANKLQNMWPDINSRIRMNIFLPLAFVDHTFTTSILIAPNFTQKLPGLQLATTSNQPSQTIHHLCASLDVSHQVNWAWVAVAWERKVWWKHAET